jgi:LPS-assembly protein
MILPRVLLVCVFVVQAWPAVAQTPPETEPPTPASASAFFDRCTRTTQWQFEQVSATHLRLTGQVEIECPDMGFFADAIDIYTDPDLRLVASGNVVFSNPEGRIAADRVEFNVAQGTGTFHQASGILTLADTVDRAQFGNQDPDVYFYGETIEKLSTRSYRLTRGGFTTCVQPTPRWEVTSRSVLLNLNDYAIARDMLLRVKGVPLMYLPVLYYPIRDDERATGFLLPTFGTSTLRGQAFSNAFFWAIDRSQDATFFHDWFTRTGQGAGAEYRYVAGEGSFGNLRYYQLNQHQAEFRRSGTVTVLPAQSTYQLIGSGNQAIGRAIRLHERIDYTSSLITQQLYQQNLYQASNATRTIEVGLVASLGSLTTSALFQRIETSTDTDTSQVYGSSPRITTSLAARRLPGTPVYASVVTDAAYLPYRRVVDGSVTSDRSLARVDAQPTLRAALSRLTFLSFNTSASFRATYYSRSANLQGAVTNDSLVRRYLTLRSDIVGPVLTKVWDTPGSGFSERMKHLVEPTFALEYIPTIRNAQQVLILSDSTDQVPGGSTRFTYGISNRLLARTRTSDGSPGTTVQFLTIGLQQTYYATDRASINDTQYVSNGFRSRTVDLSDVALTVKVAPSGRFDSTTRLEYGVYGEGLRVLTTGTNAQLGAGSTSLSYSRYRRSATAKPESSLTWGTSVDLLDGRTKGSYTFTWDIARATVMNQNIGMTYLAQCCGLQAEFQKFSFPQASAAFPIPSDRRFNVSFVLAGLGTFSNFFGAFGGF